MTNPSFPKFIKIRYADNVKQRVKILNNNSRLSYSFKIYDTYEVNERLEYLKSYSIIKKINPMLRCKEILVNNKNPISNDMGLLINRF